jgi:Tol biopolymer transport system component
MVNTPQSAAANGRLNSWKDIAAYLGRDVRTVIRWEEKGLPVYRVPGGKRQAVFAYRAEIDDWMHGKTTGLRTLPLAEREEVNESGFVRLQPTTPASSKESTRKAKTYKYPQLAVVVLILLVSAFVLVRFSQSSSVQITKVTRLSGNGLFKQGQLAAGGENLYFAELSDGKIQLSSMSVGGGPISHIATPFSQAQLQDVSLDGKEILVLGRDGREEETALWIVPTDGRPLRRVGEVACHSAAFAPDGKAIAFASRNSVFITLDEGVTSHELRQFDSGPINLRWSKSGKGLRFVLQNFTTRNMTDWEIELGDHFDLLAVHRIALTPENCCLGWVETSDHDFFVTGGNKNENRLWALRQEHHWWRPAHALSVELPPPLGTMSELASDARTGRLFAIGGEPNRGEFVRFEPRSRTFSPFLPGTAGLYPDVSRDGKWIVYISIDGGPLWVSSADGKDKRQVVSSFEEIELPRWSPDGTRIAFSAKNPGRPWLIYVVSREGGTPREASFGDDNQGAPTWSADGKWLAYGNVGCQASSDCAIHRIELASGKTDTLPDSGGLRTARWSPDGRYIAALQGERHQLLVFDVAKQRWRTLSDSIVGDDLSWSHDSRYLYSNRPIGNKPEIFRIPVAGGNPESIVDLESFSRLTGKFDNGLCIAPDDSVILLRQINSTEIYALDWTLR